MAFVQQDLVQLGFGVSDDATFHVWRYKSSADLIAAIKGAGYFVEAASDDDGEARIADGDVIFVEDSGGNHTILIVNDDAAGTAGLENGPAA